MGAWSVESFGNDDACDWNYEFLDSPGLPVIQETFADVLDAGDYLESPEASNAIAAVEVLARAQGAWGVRDSYSEELDTWIEANQLLIPDDLKQQADAVLTRILAADSESNELWKETDDYQAWVNSVENLRRRVKG